MVDGTATKEAEFTDTRTGDSIKVTLSVRDIVLFRLLENLSNAIERLK